MWRWILAPFGQPLKLAAVWTLDVSVRRSLPRAPSSATSMSSPDLLAARPTPPSNPRSVCEAHPL
jgi:hypothetical protein